MRIHRLLFVTLAILGQNWSANAQAKAPDMKRLLSRHYAAIGQENLKGIRSIKMVVTEVDGFGKGKKYELIKKRPYKIRKQGTQIGEPFVTAFNGDSAWTWVKKQDSIPKGLGMKGKKLLLIESMIDSPLKLGERGDMELIWEGSAYIDRRPNYILRLLMGDFYFVDFYVDKKDFLIKKMVTYVDDMGEEIDLEVLFSNYKKLGPYLFSYKMAKKHGNDPVIDVIIGEVAIGIGAANSVFSPPEL